MDETKLIADEPNPPETARYPVSYVERLRIKILDLEGRHVSVLCERDKALDRARLVANIGRAFLDSVCTTCKYGQAADDFRRALDALV
jgi:hypothetical protein